VTWVDGWPVVGEVDPIMTAPSWPARPVTVPPGRDDFDSTMLDPRWISVRSRPDEHWSTTSRPGWFTLRARGGSLDDNEVMFVGRRQQHLSCRVRTLADAAKGCGGLAVRLDESHHYEVQVGDGEVRVMARLGSLRVPVATRPAPHGPIRLRIDVLASPPADWHPRKEPDVLQLGVEGADGAFDMLAQIDGRYLSTEVAGGFTGRVIGMYTAAGTVQFDWFDYESLDQDAGAILAP
jgi:beta-xylosidase